MCIYGTLPSHRPDKILQARLGLTGKRQLKSFENIDARSFKEAVGLLQKFNHAEVKARRRWSASGSEYLH